jgi:SAM-dependent methyltransferase
VTAPAAEGRPPPHAAASSSRIRDYYDSYWTAPITPRYEIGKVLERLIADRIGPETACLDVGCGVGETYARWVNDRAASYVGVDVSPQAVERARRSGLHAEVIEENGPLPFGDDTFDLAISIEVLEHLFSPHLLVAEVRRVLRPGGVLLVSCPNAAYWRLRANLLFGVWNPIGDELSLDQPWRDPHIRFFTPRILERMLTRAGFSQVGVGGHGGCFLAHLKPLPGQFGVSRTYERLEARFPSLLGLRLHAVATK